MEIYVVQEGDSVRSIAEAFEVEETVIETDNQLSFPYTLVPGQALLIDNGLGNRNVILRSSGYAYPYIAVETLNNTLPYLSSVNVFSYGFDETGALLPPAYDDSWIVIAGLEQATVSTLTLTPLNEEQQFDNEQISALVGNPEVQETLLNNLAVEMGAKGYVALNIDFEYVRAEDKELYTEFVRRATEFMHEYGYRVSVALAPKTSAEQPGLLYEGIDYAALGEIADMVILMTYEWGYTYGPPMAVAPINKVREVVEYAVSVIPPSKIMLGIPNYGYDWPLPYEEGVTEAESIGNVEAMRRAIQNNVPIRFDETAQSPYYRYVAEEVEHEVWFEDVRSLQAKFDLIKEFELRGATYWQLMQWFRANWLLLEDNFFIIPGL